MIDLRETLSAVSAAVPVPAPVGFERRVTRLRRRRTALRAGAAALAVAALACAATVLTPGPTEVAPVTVAPVPAPVPLVVGGHLRTLTGTSLGPVGPAVATLVGPSEGGVVVFTADGTLARVTGDEVVPLVDEPVRTAYVDGDAVVYETFTGLVRWLGSRGPSARIEVGRLMAAGHDGFVIASDDGVVAHDSDGRHPLRLGPDTTTVRQVDIGGDRIAVRTEQGLTVFADDGRRAGSVSGDLLGALAPDGGTYARQTDSRDGVELLDPTSFEATPVAGPTGTIQQIGWSGADLLVVTDRSTLWRCPGARDCTVVLSDQGAVRLR